MPNDAASRRRLNNAVAAIAQFANSRSLDVLHAARSGVPLSLASISVLGRIVESSPVGLTELRMASRLQAAALSRHIRILEEGGYISRFESPSDGRAAVVQALEPGRDAYSRVRSVNDDLLRVQLVDWTSAELEQLAQLMERLDSDLRSVEKRADSRAAPTGSRKTPARHG